MNIVTIIIFIISVAFAVIIRVLKDKKNGLKKSAVVKTLDDIDKNDDTSEHEEDYEKAITFNVAGTYFIDVNDKLLLRKAKIGDQLILVAEPTNTKDENAIIVRKEIGKIGYVPAFLTHYFFDGDHNLRPYNCYIVDIGGRIGDLFIVARIEFL